MTCSGGPRSRPDSWSKLEHAFRALKPAFSCLSLPIIFSCNYWMHSSVRQQSERLLCSSLSSYGLADSVAILHFTSFFFHRVERTLNIYHENFQVGHESSWCRLAFFNVQVVFIRPWQLTLSLKTAVSQCRSHFTDIPNKFEKKSKH